MVEWTGTIGGASGTAVFGAGAYAIELTSDCVNGKSATASILAVGPALGVGIFPDISISNITVNDRHNDIQPFTFDGYFQYTTAGLGAVGGYGAYALAIGTDGSMYSDTGGTDYGVGWFVGWGVGATTVAGSSTVTDVQYNDCSCKK